jgi:DNA mismatch repair ATPase MutS
VFPEFVEEGPYIEAEAFAHPLLPEAHAVRNDLRLDRSLRLVLISGPNMAGKSTFVRAVGINAVLAQCGGTVQARRLRMSRLALGASICVLDSLQGGVSRFYAEIQRLKLISDMTRKPVPVLFLLDELLSGTNWTDHDARSGADTDSGDDQRRGGELPFSGSSRGWETPIRLQAQAGRGAHQQRTEADAIHWARGR